MLEKNYSEEIHREIRLLIDYLNSNNNPVSQKKMTFN